MPPKEERVRQPRKDLKKGENLFGAADLSCSQHSVFCETSSFSTSVAQTSQSQMNRLVGTANQIALLSARAQRRGQACANVFNSARNGSE